MEGQKNENNHEIEGDRNKELEVILENKEQKESGTMHIMGMAMMKKII